MTRTADLSHEVSVVWEEDISRLDYVREIDVETRTRSRPIAVYGRRVGYAVLAPNAPNNGRRGSFTRRVFIIREYDRDADPGGPYRTGAPVEAVDPRTVSPCQRGVETPRVQGVAP